MLHITARMKAPQNRGGGRTSCVLLWYAQHSFGDLYTDGRWMLCVLRKGIARAISIAFRLFHRLLHSGGRDSAGRALTAAGRPEIFLRIAEPCASFIAHR